MFLAVSQLLLKFYLASLLPSVTIPLEVVDMGALYSPVAHPLDVT